MPSLIIITVMNTFKPQTNRFIKKVCFVDGPVRKVHFRYSTHKLPAFSAIFLKSQIITLTTVCRKIIR